VLDAHLDRGYDGQILRSDNVKLDSPSPWYGGSHPLADQDNCGVAGQSCSLVNCARIALQRWWLAWSKRPRSCKPCAADIIALLD
jgi:hypothetical protein